MISPTDITINHTRYRIGAHNLVYYESWDGEWLRSDMTLAELESWMDYRTHKNVTQKERRLG